MSQIKTIFKNMSWLLISQIIASICGFIWTILIARYLGVTEYGVLGFAISFTVILSMPLDFGISTHIVRHIATDNDSASKYLGNAIPLKSIFAAFTLVLSLIILILMKYDELTITVTLLFTIETILKSMMGLINGTFMAFENGKYQGITNTIMNVLLFIFILISIFTDLGIYGISISYVISNLIALSYAYVKLNNNLAKPKFEIDKNFCKMITLASIPFAITGVFYTIYYSIDVVMITNMVGNYATGIYNASYKLISVLTLFYSVYSAVIYPVMSKLFKNDEKLLIMSFEKSIKYLMMIMIPLAVATVFYSTDIIQLIYGHEYDAANTVLSILIWTVCLIFVNGSCTTLLNASYHEKSVTTIYVIAAIFNVVLNLYMIPHYSYDGAAISTVLSDLLILIVSLIMIKKIDKFPNIKLAWDLGKIILGSLVLGIALYYLKLNMWVAIPIGIVIYFGTITLLKGFDNEDKYVIREILGKN